MSLGLPVSVTASPWLNSPAPDWQAWAEAAFASFPVIVINDKAECSTANRTRRPGRGGGGRISIKPGGESFPGSSAWALRCRKLAVLQA